MIIILCNVLNVMYMYMPVGVRVLVVKVVSFFGDCQELDHLF